MCNRTWTPFEEVSSSDGCQYFTNSLYDLKLERTTFDVGTLLHLAIRNYDRSPRHCWADFQRIKNEILGPEQEVVELYPAESRLLNTENTYHLWGMEGRPSGFGFACPSQRLLPETKGNK